MKGRRHTPKVKDLDFVTKRGASTKQLINGLESDMPLLFLI